MQKRKRIIPPFPFLCEVVLEPWIGDFRGNSATPGPPAAPRQHLECWSTKPLELFLFILFVEELISHNKPMQWSSSSTTQEFQNSNEEFQLKLVFQGRTWRIWCPHSPGFLPQSKPGISEIPIFKQRLSCVPSNSSRFLYFKLIWFLN